MKLEKMLKEIRNLIKNHKIDRPRGYGEEHYNYGVEEVLESYDFFLKNKGFEDLTNGR